VKSALYDKYIRQAELIATALGEFYFGGSLKIVFQLEKELNIDLER